MGAEAPLLVGAEGADEEGPRRGDQELRPGADADEHDAEELGERGAEGPGRDAADHRGQVPGADPERAREPPARGGGARGEDQEVRARAVPLQRITETGPEHQVGQPVPK